MKLHKNIFDDNLDFLLYLVRHPRFLLQEICDEFNLKYSALFNHVRIWEQQGHFLKESVTPELGGPRYEYYLSEKTLERLREICKSLIKLNK